VGSLKKLFQSTDKNLESLINEFRKEYGSILDFVIFTLDNPDELGYDSFLINVTKRAYPPYFDADDLFSFDKEIITGGNANKIRKYIDNMRLRNLAKKELIYWTSEGPMNRLIYGIFEGYRSAYIEYAHFSRIYLFLERLYSRALDRKLEFNDLLNIYFSGLDKLITFNLDKFDMINHKKEPTIDFFQKLGKINRPDQEVINFQYKARQIIRMSLSLTYGGYGSFARIEEEFLAYLAGCSAVKHNRNQITIEDYITAYKTYYKLLKTDVTQYQAKPEILKELGLEVTSQNSQNGYIVCDKCGGYYQLQPGESPDDFSDTCECGGYLIYKNDLDN